ncbi:translation initiation factor IF-2 [Oryctolagus cuniculus]|uniref:translation initiation factor IF-2 n=1 Tax=Oryctolagus cuniculus TaxID=9986 RepID=UPI00387A238D
MVHVSPPNQSIHDERSAPDKTIATELHLSTGPALGRANNPHANRGKNKGRGARDPPRGAGGCGAGQPGAGVAGHARSPAPAEAGGVRPRGARGSSSGIRVRAHAPPRSAGRCAREAARGRGQLPGRRERCRRGRARTRTRTRSRGARPLGARARAGGGGRPGGGAGRPPVAASRTARSSPAPGSGGRSLRGGGGGGGGGGGRRGGGGEGGERPESPRRRRRQRPGVRAIPARRPGTGHRHEAGPLEPWPLLRFAACAPAATLLEKDRTSAPSRSGIEPRHLLGSDSSRLQPEGQPLEGVLHPPQKDAAAPPGD